VNENITFLCLGAAGVSRTECFGFIERIRALWVAHFGHRGQSANVPFEMNQEFAPILRQEMSANGDVVLSKVKNDLEEVRGVVQEGLVKALERGEQLTALEVQSDSLMDTSRAFKNNARTLKVSLDMSPNDLIVWSQNTPKCSSQCMS
jgi:hypothetical protein